MNVVLIGFGQAGGAIVDAFHRYERQGDRSFIEGTAAINAAKADLLGLQRVPEDRRVLIGQSRVKGHGVGADLDLGTEIAEEDISEIQDMIDVLPTENVDAFLVVAGLGGGTRAGGAPVLANHLKRIYPMPVYELEILPDSSEGGIYNRNAGRSLPRGYRSNTRPRTVR
jgi:cell division GTPase FtsZ